MPRQFRRPKAVTRSPCVPRTPPLQFPFCAAMLGNADEPS